MSKSKISYIVQSAIGLAVWIVLTSIASMKVVAAVQLAWTDRIAILGFLWALVVYFVYVLVRYYTKPDDSGVK